MAIRTVADILKLVGKTVEIDLRSADDKPDPYLIVGLIEDLSDTGRHIILVDVKELYRDGRIVRHAKLTIPINAIDMIKVTDASPRPQLVQPPATSPARIDVSQITHAHSGKQDLREIGSRGMNFLRRIFARRSRSVPSPCSQQVQLPGTNQARPAEPSPALSGEAKAAAQAAGHVISVISKEDILRKDLSLFRTHIEDICIPQIRTGGRDDGCSALVLSIDGYDKDRRELWNIPEVLEWFKTLSRTYPYVPYFLSPGSIQLYFGILERVSADVAASAVAFEKHKGLIPLMTDTFGEANVFFERTFGSDLAGCQPVIDLLTQKINRAVTNLIDGRWEDV